MVARFKADRDEQYKEFIGRCADYEAEIAKERRTNKFTYAELDEEEAGLKKLQIWLEKGLNSALLPQQFASTL